MMMASRAPWPAAPGAETVDDLASRTVPFDYVFRFQLKGEPQHTLRQTVTVSVEASFTAVSIGYGAVPEVTPVIFGPTPRRQFIRSPRIWPPAEGVRRNVEE